LGGIQEVKDCSKTWSWTVGAEFWASRERIAARPQEFWERALRVAMSGKDMPRFGHAGGVHGGGGGNRGRGVSVGSNFDAPPPKASFASETGYCFESVWHAILGEHLYGTLPAFRLLGELPRVDPGRRCVDSRESLRSSGGALLFLSTSCSVLGRD
jgi:hypothetical protein